MAQETATYTMNLVIERDGKTGCVFLTNSDLPVVQMRVLHNEVPLQDIKYTDPKDPLKKKRCLIKKGETPKFDEHDENSALRCTLPNHCFLTVPCHDGYVPVRCSGKLELSQTQASLVLSSKRWLKTPISVRIMHDPSFLDLFIDGEIDVFFPMSIPKTTFEVEIKTLENHPSLKGLPKSEKDRIKRERKERQKRGSIGYDDDDPLPQKIYRKIQRPNQVWSTHLNNWELIRKPKPRDVDWKWDYSTASWVCEWDHSTSQPIIYLKKLDRSKFSNCFPLKPTQSDSS